MARRKRRKVVKYRRPINLNIGTFTFGVIFIYLVISIIIFASKDRLSIYEVQQNKMSDSINTTGIVIRDEKIIDATASGYINYYVREGERIAKKATVYSVDETGKMYDIISQSISESGSLNQDNYTEIRDQIAVFNNYFDSNRFNNVYDFKYDLENTVLELSNESIVDQLDSLLAKNNSADNFKKIKSKQSGIITYSQDGYEDKTTETIKKKDFDTASYKKKQLKTGDILKTGDPVYKVIDGDKWEVVINVTDDQYKKLKEKTTVKVKFAKDNMEMNAKVSVMEKGKDKFAVLSMNSYMVRYINDRFLDVELMLYSREGLKIPNSSIVEKEFYTIPVEYLSKGSNTSVACFNVKQMNKKTGETEVKQITPTIYKQDDKYCYINTNEKDLSDNAILIANDSDNTYQVAATKKLEGVYNVNKGYATFKMIHKIYSNADYCIVETNVANSISLYDHIVLNSDTIKEDEKIY